MQYTVRWKDCSKSDAVVNFLEEKLAKFYDFEFVQDGFKVEIVYYAKNKTFTVRVNASVPHKGQLRAEANEADVLTAINEACSKMIDQLRRAKTQIYSK